MIRNVFIHVKWVPVTMAWCFLRLRMEERPPVWRVAADIWKSSRGQPTRGGSGRTGLQRCWQLLTETKCHVMKRPQLARDWTDPLVNHKQYFDNCIQNFGRDTWDRERESYHLGDPGVDGRIILKLISRKWDGAWTGLIWLRTGTGGELL
jgi:hypothetical protein